MFETQPPKIKHGGAFHARENWRMLPYSRRITGEVSASATHYISVKEVNHVWKYIYHG